jgi:hypothetical protein
MVNYGDPERGRAGPEAELKALAPASRRGPSKRRGTLGSNRTRRMALAILTETRTRRLGAPNTAYVARVFVPVSPRCGNGPTDNNGLPGWVVVPHSDGVNGVRTGRPAPARHASVGLLSGPVPRGFGDQNHCCGRARIAPDNREHRKYRANLGQHWIRPEDLPRSQTPHY